MCPLAMVHRAMLWRDLWLPGWLEAGLLFLHRNLASFVFSYLVILSAEWDNKLLQLAGCFLAAVSEVVGLSAAWR